MKISKIITTTFLFICSLSFSFAQDISLYTQTDVDNFDSTISHINGALRIVSGNNTSDPIISLSNLSNLNSISGLLGIIDNRELTTLSGLDNLNSVGGYLNISSNDILANIADLVNLNSVGGHVQIQENGALSNVVDGLANLNSIGSTLRIQNNSSLTSLDGFNNLYALDYLDIRFNNSLSSINGFNNLNTVGDLNIFSNGQLASLDGFSSLNSAVFLGLTHNPSLISIGFDNLNVVEGSFSIHNNDLLTSLDGFNNLITVGSFYITANGLLGSINGFNNLDTVEESFTITTNSVLTNIEGFSNLHFIGGDLSIKHNYSLHHCCGIQRLFTFPEIPEENIYISNNVFGCNTETEILEACQELYVDWTATGNNDGSSWDNAFTDLQDALALGLGTTIHIAKGTYKPTISTNKGISFELHNDLTLLGGYPNGGGSRNPQSKITILSGEIDNMYDHNGNSYHVVKIINADNVVIDGIHIKDGNANNANSFGQSRGGGIYCKGSQVTLINTTIRRNRAIYGGGLFATLSPQVILEDCEIKLNEAEYGSALYHSNETNMYLNKTRVTNNTAYVRCAVEVNNSLYTEIGNSIIANNEANNANAISFVATNRDQNALIQNSTILGGANNKSIITLQIGNNDQLDLVMNNTIVAHQDLNFDKNVKAFNFGTLNFTHNNCYFQGATVIGNGTNTLLSDIVGDLLLDTNYSVNECSPVVNMGDNNFVINTTDIDGNSRIFDTTVDIGAYESQLAGCPSPRKFNDIKETISNEISIYPNPAKNVVNIETVLKDISVIITDVLGRNMIQSNSQKTIDISSLGQGIYSLQVYQNREIKHVETLIKK